MSRFKFHPYAAFYNPSEGIAIQCPAEGLREWVEETVKHSFIFNEWPDDLNELAACIREDDPLDPPRPVEPLDVDRLIYDLEADTGRKLSEVENHFVKWLLNGVS